MLITHPESKEMKDIKKSSEEARKKLAMKEKIVIKVGTSSLTNCDGTIDPNKIDRLAEVLSALRKNGKQVLLVTSGAIAVGCARIGLDKKPKELEFKQALAAVGQAELINMYERAFEKYGQIVAQVLITKDGIVNPTRKINARNTLNKLLELSIIPIINENDTVATDEIEFGDNDTLSAHVSTLINADLLILLSDIDGLYNADPKLHPEAQIIPLVKGITPEIEQLAGVAGSNFSTGGMVTKLAAAKLCYSHHVDMMITNGSEPAVVFDILEGKNIGTLFIAKEKMN